MDAWTEHLKKSHEKLFVIHQRIIVFYEKKILTKYRKIINRSIYTTDETYGLWGWNPDGGSMSKSLYFSGSNRMENHSPSLTCSRDIDKFIISNSIGNGKLTYPVGLLTADEVMYAGGRNISSNSTFYLFTYQSLWLSCPKDINFSFFAVSYYNFSLTINSLANVYGLRLSVSLASTSTITQGDGTATNPYVVE